MNISYLILIFLSLIVLLYLYWRFYFFFRDPERKIPEGSNIVSAADGTVVYIKKVQDFRTPLSVKNKKEIHLNEILKEDLAMLKGDYFIVGVFMHPTSVHVNRAPVAGIIKKITYTAGRNLPMTLMWMRVFFRKKPYELYSDHIFTNERNAILIENKIPVFVVQIADIYVRKIECWVKENESVKKGQRIGMIRMGSQVDIIFPRRSNIDIKVKEGQIVRAGETIIAEIGI